MVDSLAVLGVVAASTLCSCASAPRPEQRPLTQTVVVNASGAPVRVKLVAGERTSNDDRFSERAYGRLTTLGAGESAQVEASIAQEWDRSSQSYRWVNVHDPVVRVWVEAAAPSWQAPAGTWYEVVGIMPAQLTVLDPAPTSGGVPGLQGEGARIEPVPPEWWPTPDLPR